MREAALEKQLKEIDDKNDALGARVSQLELENHWLRGLIMEAWGVKAFQIKDGPDWMSDDKFDIAAKPRVQR